MSLLNKIFGNQRTAQPSETNSTVPTIGAEPSFRGLSFEQLLGARKEHGHLGAGDLIDCEGINWNSDEQLKTASELVPKWKEEYNEAFVDAPQFKDAMSLLDSAILYSMICDLKPTRLMEVGCGASTHMIRAALAKHKMPCELIAIDPEPRCDISEVADAHIDQLVQQVPLADFQTLQANEFLILDTTHISFPSGDVNYLYQRILPHLNDGVVVAAHGIRLPREYSLQELEQGYSEQALLQMYLTNNENVEVIYSGGWMHEHHSDKLQQIVMNSSPSSALWFRIKKRP